MDKFKLIFNRVVSAWPVLVPVFFAFIHLCSYLAFDLEWSDINSLVSLIFQVIGGMLVLYSIDSNLELMQKESLLSFIKGRFRLTAKPVVLESKSAHVSLKAPRHEIRIGAPTNTLQGRIDELQRQIDRLKEDLNDAVVNLEKVIKSVDSSSNAKVDNLMEGVSEVKQQLNEITIGGIDAQVFGALLLLHGTVAGYFA